MIKKLIFFFIFIFVSCSGTEEKETLYTFPSLSQQQLIELKKNSEKIEGFFITTDLSDLDPSWAERGYYLYVCIRLLNDSNVNEKLKKSAIPLLIQVSTHNNKPTAESVVLFHPKTMKSGDGVFYYEEKQLFQLTDASIIIRNVEYNIFDVIVNSKGKITHLSFVKKAAKPEQLKKRFVSEKEEEEAEEEEEDYEEDENLFLNVTSFAKQFSSSCDDWAVLNYNHSKESPEYLQTDSNNDNTNNQIPQNSSDQSNSDQSSQQPANVQAHNSRVPTTSTKPIPAPAPIPEDAPYVSVPK